MYRIRIPIGLLILSLVGAIFYYEYCKNMSYASGVVIALLIMGALWEFYNLAGQLGYCPYTYLGLTCAAIGLVLILFFCDNAQDILALNLHCSVAMTIVIFLRSLANPDDKKVLEKTFCTLAGLMYLYFLLSYLLSIRVLGNSKDGLIYLLLLVLVAKSTDIGGYLLGKLCGKHKLYPAISPKKSWEGFAAGTVLAIGVIFALRRFFPLLQNHFTAFDCIVFGVVISVFSLAGDFCESLFKRRCQVKDSNQLIPEFGGILDLMDSLVFTAPVGYYAILWLGASQASL